jgi:HTH-type transcriptional regulator/antitoxin HigA
LGKIDELVDRGFQNLTAGQEAYLDVLSDLMNKYEDTHCPAPDASPVEILKYLIDDRNTTQRAVALGSGIHTSTMSEILSGQRQMNLEHMQKLAAFLEINITAFLARPGLTVAGVSGHRSTGRRRPAQKRSAAKKNEVRETLTSQFVTLVSD